MGDQILIQNFLSWLQAEGKANSTIDEYLRRVLKFKRYLASHSPKDLTQVTTSDIFVFQQSLLQRKQNSSTINGNISTLRVIYQWMVREGLISSNPVLANIHIRQNHNKIEPLVFVDLKLLVSFIETLKPNIKAAFCLMMGAGVRVGEVAKLRYSDITLRKGRVFISIKNAKWGSDREIPIIFAKAAEVVWAYRNSCSVSNEPLFRVSKRTLQWYATKFSKQTGVKFYCHLLRHMFAAKLLEHNVPIATIQYVLGHKNINMTMYYTRSAHIDLYSIAPVIY